MKSVGAPWIVVAGLDGAGKTSLTGRLARERGGHLFRLPYHEFVRPALACSGGGAPFGDVHTDRLIFAADARLTNYLIRDWRASYPLLVSQRGWVDGYIFGAVQGVSYEETDALLRTRELERATAIVYLTVEPEIGYARIRRDPDADKYETLQFMRTQHRETLAFYDAVRAGDPALAPFAGIPAVMIDTSARDQAEVFGEAVRFLDGLRWTGEER